MIKANILIVDNDNRHSYPESNYMDFDDINSAELYCSASSWSGYSYMVESYKEISPLEAE